MTSRPEEILDEDKMVNFRKHLIYWWTSDTKGFDLFPWRREIDTYKALVAEVLLQKTRANMVKAMYDQFFQKFPNPLSLAGADERDIKTAIADLGLYKRCSVLKMLAQSILAGVPNNLKALLQLPGVGEYIARAFLSCNQNVRASVPDANLARVIGRVFGIKVDKKFRRTSKFLLLCDSVTPKEGFREFNFAILDFARMICKPRNPLCKICFLGYLCYRSQEVTKNAESDQN